VLKSTLHHTGHYSPCFINNTLFDTLLGVKKVLSRLTKSTYHWQFDCDNRKNNHHNNNQQQQQQNNQPTK
jgi:hypothetical protein